MNQITYESVPLGGGVRRYAYREVVPSRRGGVGFVDALLGLGGSIVGGIFGSKAQKQQLQAQKEIAGMQAQVALALARLESEARDSETQAALDTARVQARNELIAIQSAYAAQNSNLQAQKQIAADSLSAQLYAGTQSGIFGLAQSGLEETGATVRSFPSATAAGAAAMVIATVLALSWASRPGPLPAKKRKRRKASARGSRESMTTIEPLPVTA